MPHSITPLTQKRAFASTSLPSPAPKLPGRTTATNTPLTVVLEGVYVGSAHEGFARGDTGEFWFVITSGSAGGEYAALSSKGFVGHPNTGTVDMKRGWMNVSSLAVYASNAAPNAGGVGVSFRLLESDDSSGAAETATAITNVLQGPLDAVLPGLGTGLTVAARIMELVLRLDDDDLVVSGIKGLLWSEDYRLGRFFAITESHPDHSGDEGPACQAWFSVIPSVPTPGWAFYSPPTPGGWLPLRLRTFAPKWSFDEQVLVLDRPSKLAIGVFTRMPVQCSVSGAGLETTFTASTVAQKVDLAVGPGPVRLRYRPTFPIPFMGDVADCVRPVIMAQPA